MKTRYRFIHFIDWPTLTQSPKGKNWDCVNRKTSCVIGTCSYCKLSRKWLFVQNQPYYAFNANDLADISRFMGQLPKP